MVDFAGYLLPVTYKGEGVVQSHMHVRRSAGLFDVSHMGQLRFRGPDRGRAVEACTVADVAALPEHGAALSVITNSEGGVADDCVITRREGVVMAVVNGACKHGDMEIFRRAIEERGLDAQMEYRDDLALLALQGPAAAAVLARLADDRAFADALPRMPFMSDADTRVAGLGCTVTRCGYTGEDGFELSVAGHEAGALMDALLEEAEVSPAGLAVRDSLRLEAGLCLYGNDLDEGTTPVEAGLAWTVARRRRAEGGFPGHARIVDQLVNKTHERRRVGLLLTGPPARAGAPIVDPATGQSVGTVTSGSFSPVLGRPIAMGYVLKGSAKAGTELAAEVRSRRVPATVTKMPFVPSNYHRC